MRGVKEPRELGKERGEGGAKRAMEGKREGGRERKGGREGREGWGGRGREGVFKGNCDQQRESVHQKANEWKSNGLDWMHAMSPLLGHFKGPYSSFVPQVNH